MQLSDAEREHIRLTEEYRAEVRAKLAPEKNESWLDKLVVPLVIVVVSGLLVPWILGRVEENRRALDLQSRLIEQIVADDAAAQASLLRSEPSKLDADAAQYFIEHTGNIEWVRLHYGDVPALASYVEVSTREHAKNVQKIRAGQKDLDFRAWDDAKRKLIEYISETKPRV